MNREMVEIIRTQDPLTLQPDRTVQQACALMLEHRVGAALVTSEAGELLGIFTGRDAMRVLADATGAETQLHPVPLVQLHQVMTRDPDSLPPHHTAIDALRLMRDGGFRHVPIVEDGRVIGIVSRGDFRGLEQDRLDEETGIWERMR